MMKIRSNTLVALALITLGLMLVASGMSALAGRTRITEHQQISPASDLSLSSDPGATTAELVGYGTDKATYNRGDTAKGYITIKNSGNAAINDASLRVTVERSMPLLGTVTLGSDDLKLTGLNIGPGETKKAEYSVEIPREYAGISTAGNYNINCKVLVSGKEIGSFSKSIKVT